MLLGSRECLEIVLFSKRGGNHVFVSICISQRQDTNACIGGRLENLPAVAWDRVDC